MAEVQARLQPGTAFTPTPLPLSGSAREDIVAFANSHRLIFEDWEGFHSRFDLWRERLNACDRSSVEVTLRRFAGTIGDVATQAEASPRSASVRELGDKLIAATEGEAEAVRQLRDTWQPDDHLRDLLTSSSRSCLDTYRRAFEELGSEWDDFREAYDAFRTREPELSAAEMVTHLGQLVARFRDIVVAVRELPAGSDTRDVSAVMAEAAEAEDLALRKLRGTFQKSPGAPGEDSEGVAAPEETGEAAPEGVVAATEQATFTPQDPTRFDAFDEQLARSNASRRQAVARIADLLQKTTEDTRTAVDEFAQHFEVMVGEWDRFHIEYDEWAATEGGCDRSSAASTLGRFTSEFAALARSARELPGGALLGPLRELLVEAAEIEEEGVRELRDSWRPFAAEVYKDFQVRRNTAAKLRRQVASGLDALLDQYDITLSPP